MAEKTGINWCDSTFNPWIGCTKVSPACDHCYAERLDVMRFSQTMSPPGSHWGPGQPRHRTKTWSDPVKWNGAPFAECPACGWRGEQRLRGLVKCPQCGGVESLKVARRRVFCASLADWLDNEVPIEWLVNLLDLIRRTPNLDWLLLSKRIGNWRKRLEHALESIGPERVEPMERWELRLFIGTWLRGTPPANVWAMATIVTQEEADRDIAKLFAVPALVRGLSIEPMLGPITLPRTRCDHGSMPGPGGAGGVTCPDCKGHGERDAIGCRRLHWVICGGESGPHARPMHPDWVRSLRDQCAAAGVAFLMKQWGEWRAPTSAQAATHLVKTDGTHVARVDALQRSAISGRIEDLVDRGHQGWARICRPGKAAAGRLLDGIEHNGFPR